MDNTTNTSAPAQGNNEDKELADLLADLGGDKKEPMPTPAPTPTPAATASNRPMNTSVPSSPAPITPAPPSALKSAPKLDPTTAKSASNPVPVQEKRQPGTGSDLEDIKNKALDELRPLAERINLPPAEKFDTLLLMIRTTDDKELIKYAHDIAVQIEDKDKQAQALLDIVKEVDFFTHQ